MTATEQKLVSMGPASLSGNSPATGILARANLSEKSHGVSSQLTCHDYLKALISLKMRQDAIRFIAAWLPPRDSIWFGCLGVWQVYRLLNQSGARELLDKIVQYVTQPTEANLSAIASPAEMRKDHSIPGMLAQAALYSGNNISPYPKKAIKPDPALVGKTVATALVLSAAKWPGKDLNSCLDHFVEMGLDIAEGKHLWGPNPGQHYPGLRDGSKSNSMFEKPRNIWDK